MYSIEKKIKSNVLLNVKNEDLNSDNKPESETEFKNGNTVNNKLLNDIKIRSPSCGLIVVDNFYKKPHDTRKYILNQEFSVVGNYPGKRTTSFANQQLKDIIQSYVNAVWWKYYKFSDAHSRCTKCRCL